MRKMWNSFKNIIFSFMDKNYKQVYIACGIVCVILLFFVILSISGQYKVDKNTGKYYFKNGKNKITVSLIKDIRYTNEYKNNGKEDLKELKKEDENSNIIYLNNVYDAEEENYKINAYIPKINIANENNNEEIAKTKENVKKAEQSIDKIIKDFNGKNKLKFTYYAYSYKNYLSIGYILNLTSNEQAENENIGFVYNSKTKETVNFKKYLKENKISERKVKKIINKILKNKNIREKYKSTTKRYYITEQGIIYLMLDDEQAIKIAVE